MATVTAMNVLLPPQPSFRFNRPSAPVDHLQLSEQFWKAVKLDSPTSPTFESHLYDSPIDEKIMQVVHVDETTTTFVDDPIVAFETLDCYSPNRPRFTPTGHGNQANNPLHQPCPYGEPLDLHRSPAPTLGSIRYHDKPVSRSASPWSAMTLRSTRFRKPSLSSSNRQGPSVLALASAFLDSIVRLTRSRSSTPTTFNDGQGAVTILESEVLINVLEDGKRAGLSGSESLCGVEKALEKLELPALSPILSPGGLWDTASPLRSSEGPGTYAQDSDARSKEDHERQLDGMRTHVIEQMIDVQRGRALRT